MQCWAPTPRVSDLMKLGGAQDFGFRTSFQVTLILLVWGPHLENRRSNTFSEREYNSPHSLDSLLSQPWDPIRGCTREAPFTGRKEKVI